MLDSARHQQRRLVASTRPIAPVDPISTFCGSRATNRALWYRPAAGEALVGIGNALTVDAEVAAAWRQLAPGATLMGGIAFDPRAPATSLWAGFGEARFIVPERLISQRGGAASLTTASGSWHTARPTLRPRSEMRLGLDTEAWITLVGEVAAAIRAGELGLRKVVLARAEQVRVTTSVETALRFLAQTYPSCTIFAFGTPDAVFVGATPERLVAVRQRTATTMALAGSAPRGTTPSQDHSLGERLLSDPKERTEHAVVTDALREALAPLSTRVVADAQPRLERLPNVQHLITPIRARLKPDVSVLDLLQRLHPTPAVGGYPREQALALIREREGLDRGWYAAPFGWINADGDGEFVVALRCALIAGDAATLFAGCGIVGDSDPETEYAEWGWKLRPMRAALGVAA